MKQKLIELLKTVPEIKEDLDRKEYVTTLLSKNWIHTHLETQTFMLWECNSKEEAIWKHIKSLRDNDKYKDYTILIELCIDNDNDIQEYHLRMYCKNKWYPFAIWNTGKIIWSKNKEWSYAEIQLENKSFDNQGEEVYEEIFNFLTK